MQPDIADNNLETELSARVAEAVAKGTAMRIVGGDSKSFYGNPVEAEALKIGTHSGVIDYDPAELVITLRGGCKLKQVEALLAENNQMLGFEPLHLGGKATIGGVVATGLAGPRRAYAGGVRDFILGVKLLNGRGEIMNFGGRVIKNVAGFDVSRLMVGAQGSLGVILEISLRVIPCFETEISLGFEHDSTASHIQWINELGARPLPLSASGWYQGRSYIRLSGSRQGVDSAVANLGGELEKDVWKKLRTQKHEFFTGHEKILRLSLPQTSEDLFPGEPQLIEWGGAQRWLAGDYDLAELRQKVESVDGTVCAYRGVDPETLLFHPLNESVLALHRTLKSSFDPARIFNPGRLYSEL
jgi:glycolate oxidase FAD binding subunit